MSVNERRFTTNWEDVNKELSNEVREKVPSKDKQAEENEQAYNQVGAEEEHIVERLEPNGETSAVKREFTDQHLKTIAQHEQATNTETISTKNDNSVALVEIETDDYKGSSEYDVGPEKEDVTGVVSNIGEILENLDQVEKITEETSPKNNVAFKRQGTLTEMMLRGSNGEFDWANAENGIFPGPEFLTGKPRYFAFDDTYTGVMQVAGTGSIQTTMRPKIYDEKHEEQTDPDKWVVDFSGGGERVGMHALSPLIYGPFMSSPVINQEKKIIETLNGRDKAYGQGFQTEWDSKGLGKTEEEYVTENSKAGYSPILSEIESIQDLQDFKAESEWTFSKPVEAGKMKVVEEGESYDPEKEYETLVENVEGTSYEFVEKDDAGIIRVGHEDWDLNGGRSTIKLSEFPDYEHFEGKIYLVDEDGNKKSKRVVVDYQDEEIFPEMSDEEFLNEYRGHFEADATAVWEPFRMRPSEPAFEYRDICNNPFRDAAIATQIGVFRKWREIQEFAEEQLGLYEDSAQELRLGVNQEGLSYEIDQERGITLQDAWIGSEKLETSLYNIIAEGVDEMSGDKYSVEEYQQTMIGSENKVGLLPNGLTPGEMIASEYGVEVEGDVLYSPEDLFVGEQPYPEPLVETVKTVD